MTKKWKNTIQILSNSHKQYFQKYQFHILSTYIEVCLYQHNTKITL